VLYDVSFETSNVLHIVERLIALNYNLSNNINTGKHVGAPITLDDVKLVQVTLKALILHYELAHNITSLPSRLKLHEMLKVIRETETADVKKVAKDVVTEILKPLNTGKKLSKKEQITIDAKVKSNERRLATIKKLGK
jgi:hypothetical protein